MKIDEMTLTWILTAWFDGGQYLKGEKDRYGDVRYVGFHNGHTSEVVMNDEREDELTVYQIDQGLSYLNAFCCESHKKSMELIGMTNTDHDFEFHEARNYSECHTTIKMIK